MDNEAMSKALRNHIVLKNIIGRLKFDELKSCRLVNYQWNAIASTVMRDRGCCKIHVVYDDACKTFCKHSSEQTNVKIISEEQKISSLINLMMSNSRNFSCTHFIFEVPYESNDFQNWSEAEEHVQVQKFFRVHGSKIQSLTLNYCPTTWKSLLEILSRYAPNIENLHLESVYFGDNVEIYSTEDILSLPSLKVLKWNDDCPEELISKILRSSPNLERASRGTYLGDYYLKYFVELGKSFAVNEVFCNNQTSDQKQLLEFALATPKPKLEKLTFSWYPPRCGRDFPTPERFAALLNCVSTLLETSQLTLKVVDFSEAAYINLIRFPELPNLSILRLPKYYLEFAEGELIEKFPNLKTLDLSKLVIQQ